LIGLLSLFAAAAVVAPAAGRVPPRNIDERPRAASLDDADPPGPANLQRVSSGTAAAHGGCLEHGNALPPRPAGLRAAHLRSSPAGVGAQCVACLPPATPEQPRGPPAAVV
jgi:hypothetical protein